MGSKNKPQKKPIIEILSGRNDEYTEKELYSMIMCGEIRVNGETIRDPRRKISNEDVVTLTARKWVSRGGEKLEHALARWEISPAGKIVLDAGASTGGFTDCLLQNGAVLVHAVDVGYNQLDYRLRTDKRVNVLERTNIMSVKELDPKPDFAVADLSFRSISGAATKILKLTTGNLLIALIKPQFELAETEGFDGIIRDPDLLADVLKQTAANLEDEGVEILDVLQSPIKGGKGNVEFLFKLKIAESEGRTSNIDVLKDFLKNNK